MNRETIIPASGAPSTGTLLPVTRGLQRWLSGKESAYQCRRCWRCGFNSWVGKISWRRKWQSTPLFLPEKSHGQGSWWVTVHGIAESDTIESLSMHRPLTPIMEQNPAGIEHQRDEAMGFLMTHGVGGREWGWWVMAHWKQRMNLLLHAGVGPAAFLNMVFPCSKPELELRHNF